MEEDLITTAEAGQALGVTAQRVRAMIKAGQLPATKFGRDWLVRRQDLDLVRDRQPGRPALEKLTAEQYAARGVVLVSDKMRLPLLRCATCGATWAGRDWRCPKGCNEPGADLTS